MDVTLPQLAEGADSGTVVSVFISEGDQVEKDQTILEIENEKAVAPIPSTVSGTVTEAHINEGDTISVGQSLISVDTEGKGAKKPKKEKPPKKEAKPEAEEKEEEIPEKEAEKAPERSVKDPFLGYQYESKSGFPPPASPTVRRIARLIDLDLTKIRGSARGGRIILEDIQAYIKRLEELAFSKAPKEEAKPKEKLKSESVDFSQWGSVHREPYSSIRKTIGRRMLESWSTIPHVNQFDEADITNLMDLREKFKSEYKEKGANLTLTALSIKAVYEVLKQYPVFNASLDEENNELVYKDYYHIGIAVDTDPGLLVPVIRDVDQKSLFNLSNELQEIAKKARDRKLSGEEMKGHTFTISNLGGIGGSYFTPIINYPDVAILGLSRGVEKPMVVNGKIEKRIMMPMCLSYDHRVIDGAAGARFITALVEAFENFKKKDIKL